jgi:hypothetical protein
MPEAPVSEENGAIRLVLLVEFSGAMEMAWTSTF